MQSSVFSALILCLIVLSTHILAAPNQHQTDVEIDRQRRSPSGYGCVKCGGGGGRGGGYNPGYGGQANSGSWSQASSGSFASGSGGSGYGGKKGYGK